MKFKTGVKVRVRGTDEEGVVKGIHYHYQDSKNCVHSVLVYKGDELMTYNPAELEFIDPESNMIMKIEKEIDLSPGWQIEKHEEEDLTGKCIECGGSGDNDPSGENGDDPVCRICDGSGLDKLADVLKEDTEQDSILVEERVELDAEQETSTEIN